MKSKMTSNKPLSPRTGDCRCPLSRMPKLNKDDVAKIFIAVDRFREHLGRDEAIKTINAIIAKRWTIENQGDIGCRELERDAALEAKKEGE